MRISGSTNTSHHICSVRCANAGAAGVGMSAIAQTAANFMLLNSGSERSHRQKAHLMHSNQKENNSYSDHNQGRPSV
jgi:hypothetical protein